MIELRDRDGSWHTIMPCVNFIIMQKPGITPCSSRNFNSCWYIQYGLFGTFLHYSYKKNWFNVLYSAPWTLRTATSTQTFARQCPMVFLACSFWSEQGQRSSGPEEAQISRICTARECMCHRHSLSVLLPRLSSASRLESLMSWASVLIRRFRGSTNVTSHHHNRNLVWDFGPVSGNVSIRDISPVM